MAARRTLPGPRGIILVSLGSSLMTDDYIKQVTQAAEPMVRNINICLLDVPETVNQKHIHHLSYSEARVIVEGRCSALTSRLEADRPASLTVTSWSSYARRPGFLRYLKAVYGLFRTSVKFERHCRNQVFRNLQPVLRAMGIAQKLYHLTAALADYILKEVALKLFVSRRRLADIEFAPKPEMELMEAIYSGKYPELSPLAVNRLRYVVVEPQRG